MTASFGIVTTELFGRIRIPIPLGVALSDQVWRRRHRWVSTTLLCHLPVLLGWSVYHGVPARQWALLLVPATFLVMAQLDLLSRGRLRPGHQLASAFSSAGLMACATYLVSVSGGYIEAHFHFFVLLPVVALYESWTPFLVAVGVVLIDHGVVGTVWPHAIYGQSMDHMEHPWKFACIHAFFVAMAGTGSLVTWRLAESARVDQQQLIEQLHFRATHDPLTGLANREALAGALRLALTVRPRDRLSVLLLDLDRFKEVNDTLGHLAGDELLQVLSADMAAVIARRTRGALLVRLGGDEFAVLLPRHDLTEVRAVAEDIAAVVTRSVLIDGILVAVGVSIGVAIYSGSPGPGRGSEDDTEDDDMAQTAGEKLLRQADVAMYQAKSAGETLAFYDPSSDEHARERLNVLNDLRAALATQDQIVLHYQPKVSLADGRIIGVEALARWAHPRRGLLPPSEFVELAQTTQHAEQFTRVVIETAIQQAACWRDQGRCLPVAVNVTPRCLMRDVFVEFLSETLERYDVPAQLLRIEITEDAIVADPVAAIVVLEELDARGIGVSIDDFGTGFSSLSYLRHLRVDELKIDRSFVSGLGTAHDVVPRPRGLPQKRPPKTGPTGPTGSDQVLLASIIELGHSLGMSVVAEGIEAQQEADILRELGCDSAQGFFYYRPMTAEALAADLDTGHRQAGFPA